MPLFNTSCGDGWWSRRRPRGGSSTRATCLNLSGEFYLTELINEPQYILNAIYDVLLEHRSWDGDAARDFAPDSSRSWS